MSTSYKKSNSNLVSRPVVHNQARTGTLRRKLTISNPVNQYQVTRAVVEKSLMASDACVALRASHARAKGLVAGRADFNPLRR